MVNEQEQDSGRRAANHGVRDVMPEPNQINAYMPYDFNGRSLTRYGGLLPVGIDAGSGVRKAGVAHETVWTSAFLSILAIGPDDPYPKEDRDYLDLLLEERELFISLARKGCTVKCIISPANKNYIRHAGIDYAVKRTNRSIDFIGSKDLALNHIDWALPEPARNICTSSATCRVLRAIR
jgi:hypothetical protein